MSFDLQLQVMILIAVFYNGRLSDHIQNPALRRTILAREGMPKRVISERTNNWSILEHAATWMDCGTCY
jgi:hypothetical protein